jgi:shikimate 5-dehydrogenase
MTPVLAVGTRVVVLGVDGAGRAIAVKLALAGAQQIEATEEGEHHRTYLAIYRHIEKQDQVLPTASMTWDVR